MTKKILTSLLLACPCLLLFLIFALPSLFAESLETTQVSGDINTGDLEPANVALLAKGAVQDRVESTFSLTYPAASRLPQNHGTDIFGAETWLTRMVRNFPWSERKKIPKDNFASITPINKRFRLLSCIDDGIVTPFTEGANTEKHEASLRVFLLDDEKKVIHPMDPIEKELSYSSNVLGALLNKQKLAIFRMEEHDLCAYTIDVASGQVDPVKKIKTFPEDVDVTSLPDQYFHQPLLLTRQYKDQGETKPTLYRITDVSGQLEELSFQGFEGREGDRLVSGLLSTRDVLYFVDYPLAEKTKDSQSTEEAAEPLGTKADVYQYDFQKKRFVPYLEINNQKNTFWYTTPEQLLFYEQKAKDTIQFTAYNGQKASASGQKIIQLKPNHGSQIMNFNRFDAMGSGF